MTATWNAMSTTDMTVPTLKWESLTWEDVSEPEGAGTRLIAAISIGGLMMHLEARAVAYSDDEERLQTTIEYPDDHIAMCAIADTAFETLDIGGRDYFLFALPYGI